MSARFASILHQLHLPGDPSRSLCFGCGDFPEFAALSDYLPTWAHIGLDVDLPALRRAPRASPRICADGRRLPFATKFALVVIRHPNFAEKRAGWEVVFADVPHLLAENGLLLVTGYDLNEIEFARRAIRARQMSLDEASLAPPDLAGRDRFALLFRRD